MLFRSAFKAAGYPSGSEEICRLMSASGDQVIVGVNGSRRKPRHLDRRRGPGDSRQSNKGECSRRRGPRHSVQQGSGQLHRTRGSGVGRGSTGRARFIPRDRHDPRRMTSWPTRPPSHCRLHARGYGKASRCAGTGRLWGTDCGGVATKARHSWRPDVSCPIDAPGQCAADLMPSMVS